MLPILFGQLIHREGMVMNRLLTKAIWNSRIQSENVTKSERFFGYFAGPCLTYMLYTAAAGNYLTQFYTDVLGLAGSFLTLMPLVSKLISSVVSILLGRWIDRTRSVQGKARPWILLSGVLLTVCAFLLYAVPQASYSVQIAWVVISYNLFFSLAWSVYSLSHSLMVPLSTRNTAQRDSLAMMTSMATSMIPGMLSTIIMPLLITKIGVGADARISWITVMGSLSVLAIPAVLLEYYFTLERVTEQMKETTSVKEEVSFGKQVRSCLGDKYWVMIVLFMAVLHFCTGISHGVQLYYCNWVLGNSIDSGVAKQILVNMIGQAPLGYGLAILWPLVRKFGKRAVSIVGFTIAAAGSLLIYLAGDNMMLVLGGLLIRSTGALPTYTMAAFLAEALDHVEQTRRLRADGFSASINSIGQTVMVGLSQTIILAGINLLGYIVPENTKQIIAQPEEMHFFFLCCYALLPMIGYLLCAVIVVFYKPNLQVHKH